MESLRTLFTLLKRYASAHIEYAKLSAAEKFTLLAGALAVGVVLLMCVAFMLVFFGLACVEALKSIMHPAFAYLATGFIFLVAAIVVVMVKKTFILNPISRFITAILFDKRPEDK